MEPELTGRPASTTRRLIGGNSIARVGALISLGIATLLVARVGGPTVVGEYALLRVIPGLVGVVASAGLPTACAYFLARRASDRTVPWSIFSVAVISGVLGTAAWLCCVSLLRALFFDGVSRGLVALAGTTILSQLMVSTAKGCTQGRADMRGANRLIVIEEASFLPPFLALTPMPIGHLTATIWALLLADVGAAAYGWAVLARRGMFHGASGPSRTTVTSVLSYGARGQVGGVMTLLNLRLDFVLLGSLSNAAVVGSYAVASKFAELLRVPSLAMNYVLYPRFAREGPDLAARSVRHLAPRALLLMAVCAVLIAAAVGPLIPWVYGADFRSAVSPAYVLVAGLVTDGLGAVLSAWLLGCGRPGLNSLAIGVGVAVTLLLDILLIPSHQAMGAAAASAAAYVTVTGSLLLAFGVARRTDRRAAEKSANREPTTPNGYGAAAALQQMR